MRRGMPIGMDGQGDMPFQQNGGNHPWSGPTTTGPMMHNGSVMVGEGLNSDNDWDEWMHWDPLSPALSPGQQPPQYGHKGTVIFFFVRMFKKLSKLRESKFLRESVRISI